MSAIITPFEGTELFNTASFNNRISQINTGFSYVSNPNLLDNWYFGNPVNQRGKTEYTRDGYTVDRWALVSTGAGSFILHGSDNYSADVKGTFYQRSENERFIVGAKYTLSVLQGMITSPTLYHDTFDLTASNGWKSRFNVNGGTFGFYYGKNTSDIQFDLDDTKTLIAVKLELGPTQTLAHREGDKWILNEVPDYGEQLRRCLRHDYIIGSNTDACPICTGTAYSSDSVIAVVDLPEVMRSNPAVVISDGIQIRFSATKNFTVSTVANYGFSGDKVQLYFSGLSGLTPGQSCDLYTQPGNKIEFNANL